MAPLLRTYFNPRHRSFLSTLFTATFLASVLSVTFPCPVRSTADNDGEIAFDSPADGKRDVSALGKKAGRTKDEIIVMLNQRRGAKGRFLEED